MHFLFKDLNFMNLSISVKFGTSKKPTIHYVTYDILLYNAHLDVVIHLSNREVWYCILNVGCA